MSFFEDVWNLTKRLATIDETLDHLETSLDEITEGVKFLGQKIHEIDVRVARLEEGRDLQRERVNTALERLKLEVERLELQASRQIPPSDQNR